MIGPDELEWYTQVMRAEDLLEFLAPDDIRIKGTRIGVETIYYDYIHRSSTAEEIARRYPSLDLEKVYAALYYYHTHREEMNCYLESWLEAANRARQVQAGEPRVQAVSSKLAAHRGTAKA